VDYLPFLKSIIVVKRLVVEDIHRRLKHAECNPSFVLLFYRMSRKNSPHWPTAGCRRDIDNYPLIIYYILVQKGKIEE
jgi:hypothetical protein